MSNDAPEKMELTSMNVAEEKRARLKQLFPEVFTEDRIDFEQLRRVLGDWVEPGKERYGLNWPGKAECMKIIQAPSIATLKPARDESVDFDHTENLFIEGDNLEVLKLLQKAYFGKIKMIYIDPPYNTGKEFIYPDKYQDNLDTYLAYTGQVDDEGKRFATNTDAGGRFHANWLNMMYPRLYLAKNLLREDGVIFISIDDNEIHNLRELCDQVFGEENFEGHIHWRRRHNQPNDPTKMIGLVAEHILAYAKNKSYLKEVGVGKIALTGTFTNSDNDPRGPWASKPWKVGSDQSGSRYKITTPTGTVHDEEWMGDENNFKRLLADNRVIFPDKGNGAPRKKYYESEREEEGQCANNWWSHDLFGHNQEGNKENEELFGIKNIFSNPKPTKLIRQLTAISNAKGNDIVMDFFAGSGTTGVSVLDYNRLNNEKCKYICVQLPETCYEKTDAFKSGYKNIADIGKERMRRVANAISEKTEGELDLGQSGALDLGFKVFKLSRSNFNIWDGDAEKAEDLARQLELHVNHIDPASGPEDIFYELLLKAGFELTTRIEKRTMAGKDVYAVADGALLVCLDQAITPELIDALADADPLQVICLDEGFKGNDQLKTNAVQTFKARAASRETEIVFRTV